MTFWKTQNYSQEVLCVQVEKGRDEKVKHGVLRQGNSFHDTVMVDT